MLTERERKWLKEREEQHRKFPWNDCYREYTSACKFCRDKCKYVITSCPLYTNWQDAAEFEARAKVIALHIDIEDVPCAHGMTMFCPAKHFKGKGCGDWCRMRMAHLQAEQEMDQ